MQGVGRSQSRTFVPSVPHLPPPMKSHSSSPEVWEGAWPSAPERLELAWAVGEGSQEGMLPHSRTPSPF